MSRSPVDFLKSLKIEPLNLTSFSSSSGWSSVEDCQCRRIAAATQQQTKNGKIPKIKFKKIPETTSGTAFSYAFRDLSYDLINRPVATEFDKNFKMGLYSLGGPIRPYLEKFGRFAGSVLLNSHKLEVVSKVLHTRTPLNVVLNSIGSDNVNDVSRLHYYNSLLGEPFSWFDLNSLLTEFQVNAAVFNCTASLDDFRNIGTGKLFINDEFKDFHMFIFNDTTDIDYYGAVSARVAAVRFSKCE